MFRPKMAEYEWIRVLIDVYEGIYKRPVTLKNVYTRCSIDLFTAKYLIRLPEDIVCMKKVKLPTQD